MIRIGDTFGVIGNLLGFPGKATGAGGGGSPETFFLLKEDGSVLLLETADHILKEDAA